MLLEFEGAGTYRLITSSTIERDIAISNVLRSSGAQEAMIDAIKAGEEPDARLFNAISGSGKLFELLGASLVPEGVDPLEWSPELAKRTADTLKRVTAPEAKALLVRSVVELVKAFFLAGLVSSVTSPSFLRATANGVEARPDGVSGATMSSATGH